MTQRIPLTSVLQERAIRAGEFVLTPDREAVPFIASQPAANFRQFTWLQGIQLGTPIFQYVTPQSNKVIMLQGTEFILGIEAVDLSNTLNINDTRNLSYAWTRDESPIYELNGLNGGIGTSIFQVPAASSSVDLTGRYVCEVSNAYGTIQSEPIDIEIVDPIKHPKLLKNLILNGDGDGGLDGWQTEYGFIVRPFIQNSAFSRGFGSFRLASWTNLNGWLLYDRVTGQELAGSNPNEFFFSTDSDASMFYNMYKYRLDRDSSFSVLNARSTTNILGPLDWYLDGYINYTLPQIVPNEDYTYTAYTSSQPFAAFYPGIQFIDKYNRNISINSTTLQDEYKNYQPQYFTRDRIQFENNGGVAEVSMNQVVDLTEVSDMVDGNMYGVKYVTSQFFAYVGAGITGYSVKITTADGTKTYNYYLKDMEVYYNKLRLSAKPGDNGSSFTDPNALTTQYLFMGDDFGNVPAVTGRDMQPSNPRYWNGSIPLEGITPPIRPLQGSDIEITPLVEDRTTIVLEYLDEFENVLKEETINGPTDRDVWAIKEKVYFPLTLYGLFEFVIPANNPIKVFGQTYTTTTAIERMFSGTVPPINLTPTIQGSQDTLIGNTMTDVNARFLLNKFQLKQFSYPANVLFGLDGSDPYYKRYRAVDDFGAAAMFGVGKNIVVPAKTRSVRITVKFKNLTRAISDTSAKIKGWYEQEIYANDFGDGAGIGLRNHEYGNPRCGVTSMKFLLSPNDFQISDQYTTYQLPPIESTVIGLQKAKYQDPSAFNTAIKTNFTYDLLVPQGVPSPPTVTNPYLQAAGLYNLATGLDVQALANLDQSGSYIINPFNSGTSIQMPDESDDIIINLGDPTPPDNVDGDTI